MKVTVAIPNYNGENLLRKNLPNIVKAGADEILIIDDVSTDNSIKIISEEFPAVKLLINKKNLGFIPTVNNLFLEATGDVVILLNNDVWVQKDFMSKLIPHFKNEKVFAVNCHEQRESFAQAFWKDGFFEFTRGKEVDQAHRSSWASGGSAAYRKSIWQLLGGFDPIFAPFYWEDVDISFRAIKAGFEILWESESRVLHQHQTIISKEFSSRYITRIQQRNQLLFIWKNIHNPKLLGEHRVNLIKRLLKINQIGYWMPFLKAVFKIPQIKNNSLKEIRTDEETINYAKS